MGGKVKYHTISEKERMKYLSDFYDSVASLKNRDEVKRFFKDLLTLSEIVMISRRIQVALGLLEGKTYEEIKGKLKVGSDTIKTVENWLNNGFGGYKNVMEKIEIREVNFDQFLNIVTKEEFWGKDFSNHVLRLQKDPQEIEKFRKIILK